MDNIQRIVKEDIFIFGDEQVVITTSENRDSFIMMRPYKTTVETIDLDDGSVSSFESKASIEEEDAIKAHNKYAKRYEGM